MNKAARTTGRLILRLLEVITLSWIGWLVIGGFISIIAFVIALYFIVKKDEKTMKNTKT